MAQALRYRYDSAEQLSPAAPQSAPRKKAELELIAGRRPRRVETDLKGHAQMNLVLIGAIVFALIIVISGLRVTISALTVSTMMENTKIQSQIKSARSAADDLQVQQAVFSSPDRVYRIAVDSLGMIPASQVDELNLSNN